MVRSVFPRTPWTVAVGALALVAAWLAATDGQPQEPVVTLPASHVPDPPPPPTALGAAGHIESITVDDTTVTMTGWAIDLDRPTSSEIRVSIDGTFVASAPADATRFDVEAAYGSGADHGFTVTVELPSTRPQSVCVHTAPDDDLVICRRVAGASWRGVLITPRGVMVRILDVLGDDRYRVRTPCGNEATVTGGERVRTTQILIDPGHGGSEVASVGPNGLGEKHLNLDVALRASDKLRERGYDVELTRTTDVRHPIAIRAGLAKALRPDLFLSLHHNGGATARQSVPGTQVYYQHDDPESRRAGGVIYEELFAAASAFPTAWVGNSKDGVSTRLNARGTDFYGIHRRTPDITSLITEFLWLSNGPEAALLAGNAIREAEASALARGIDRWYRTEHAGSGFIPDFVDTFDSGGGGFEGCVDPAL